MERFEIILTQDALDARQTYDVVTQAARYVEVMEAKKVPLADALHKFLTLEIYFGRSRNAGHQAFFHANYSFPQFARIAAEAARAMRAEEYAAVIDDLGALMASPRIAAIPEDQRDPYALDTLGLEEPFNRLNHQSFDVRLSPGTIEARLEGYSQDIRTWVMARYEDAQDEAYYALAAAWLLDSAEVVIKSPEERAALLTLPPRPKPPQPAKPADKKTGWFARWFSR